MKNKLSTPEALYPALRIFIVEMNDHLELCREVLQKISEGSNADNNPPVCSEDITSLIRRFHTIRGGAGFLQLTETSNTAHQAEKYFADKTTTHNYVEAKQKLKETVETLSKQLQQITSCLS